MNRDNITLLNQGRASALATNKVLRNTYLLLGLTFMFSGMMAYISYAMRMPPLNILVMIVGVYGLMFLTQALKDSPWGLVSCFAFTGFLGFTLGPILNLYIANFSNGHQLIATALGGTGIIFFAYQGMH